MRRYIRAKISGSDKVAGLLYAAPLIWGRFAGRNSYILAIILLTEQSRYELIQELRVTNLLMFTDNPSCRETDRMKMTTTSQNF